MSIVCDQEGTFSMSSSHRPGGSSCRRRRPRVANAGLLLPAALAERLGIEAVVDQLVDLGERPGGYWPGRKVPCMGWWPAVTASTTPMCRAFDFGSV
jgi:hypothetical protein